MKLARTYLLVVLFVSCDLFAQSPSADTTSFTVPGHTARAVLAGVVTKEPRSAAVKKAVIELIAESQSEGGNYTAITGADGSFRIENIVAGRYRLFVERARFHGIG